MRTLNWESRRGDTPVIQGFLLDADNQPVDDPGAQYTFAARTTPNATGPALIEVTTAQFAPGEGRCPIPVQATASFTYDRVLWYDLDVVETNGNVTTVLAGRWTVKCDQAY